MTIGALVFIYLRRNRQLLLRAQHVHGRDGRSRSSATSSSRPRRRGFLPEWGFTRLGRRLHRRRRRRARRSTRCSTRTPRCRRCTSRFALMLGCSLARLVRHARLRRCSGRCYPLLVTFVVVATAQPLLVRRVPRRARPPRVSAVAAHALLARARPGRLGVRPAPRPAPSGAPTSDPRARCRRRRSDARRATAAREHRTLMRNRLIESRLTPNAISLTGLRRCNVVAAVLVWQRATSSSRGVAFILGSVWTRSTGATRACRARARRSARSSTRRSTASRRASCSTAVAALLRLATATSCAVAAVVVAVLASLMVSYTRARAEALGVECKVGIADRAVRVVILSVGLVFAKGAGARRLRAARAGRLRARRRCRVITVVPAHLPRARASSLHAPRRRCNRSRSAGSMSPQHLQPEVHELTSDNGNAPSTNGAQPLPERQGPRRHHRRRQLRLVVRAGRPVLQGRRPDASRSRASCTSTSAATTSATSSSPRRSTSTPTRSARTSPRRSGPARTTRSSSPTMSRTSASPVHRGMTHDGLGKYLKEKITKAPGRDRRHRRRSSRTRSTDVVVSYLPVGSEQATKWYVEQVLEAGCGFVNCIPVFIAREDYWDKRFEKAGLPIVGDDIKSQVGATIVHRALARLFHDRGVKMLRTSQLNVGGNMDFYNMLERERLESKKISKTNAVTSIMGHDAARRRRLHRPVGLRAVADRPQVGAHPPRGPGLRRRAAQRRDEARGLGLAELGRHRHRRRALLQARAQPRHRRPARRPELLPHEVAAQPAPGRRGARGDRGVHRRARGTHERRGKRAGRPTKTAVE